MEYFPGFLALAFSLIFLAAGATRWKGFGAGSRLELVTSALTAVAALAIARALMPWGSVSPLLWLVPVAVTAAAVAAAVWIWPHLPVLRPDKPRRRTVVFGVLNGVVVLAVTALFVL
jgi:hypothetical protein